MRQILMKRQYIFTRLHDVRPLRTIVFIGAAMGGGGALKPPKCCFVRFNPLKPELNPICYLLALLGAHHFLHVSRIRVKLLTLR